MKLTSNTWSEGKRKIPLRTLLMLQVKVADSPFKVLCQISYSNDIPLHLLGSCSTNGTVKVISIKSYQILLIQDVQLLILQLLTSYFLFTIPLPM